MIGLIRAEIMKLFTTRMWWGLLIGIVVQSAAFAGLVAFLVTATNLNGADSPMPASDVVARMSYTAGLGNTYLCTLALGVIAMAGEGRHRTLSAALLASPQRWRLVVAKLVAVLAAGAGYGVASAVAGVAVGLPILVSRGLPGHLTDGGVPQALALSLLATALWAVIGVGVGTLISNQIVALLVAIGLAWIVDGILALVLNLAHLGAYARFLPGQATGALVSTTGTQGIELSLLPWWGGALTLLGYALVSAGLGATLTLRRDVT